MPATIPDPTVDDPSSLPGLGWTKYQGTSYVVSEPVGAGTWYPVNDEPTDKATYRFTVIVDEPLVGRRQRRAGLGHRSRHAPPLSCGSSASRWRAISRSPTSTPTGSSAAPRAAACRSATTSPTTRPPDSVAALRQTAAMMSFIEELIGPYPFDGYGAVMVDDPNLFYALETQAMSTFQSSCVDELTVVHELAHQWFGNAVTVAQWRDLWLAEGFATYFEFLWEHRGDQAGFDAGHGPPARLRGPARRRPGRGQPAAGSVRRSTPTTGVRSPWRRCGSTVGDAKFKRILRAWYRTYRNKNATSQDFIELAAGIGGPSARPVLRAWLYEQPVPPLPGSTIALSAPRAAPPRGGPAARHRRPPPLCVMPET